MELADYFSPDYRTAKQRFIAAAASAGFRLESFDTGTTGPAGEALTVDSAWLGNPRPARLIVLSSGLHGVEGFFGSAVQLAWLARQAARLSLQPDAALVLIHALNPYGFAWRRRWNENNVDLNRNFLADRSFLQNDPDYAQSRRIYDSLSALLNPDTLPSRFEPYTLEAARVVLVHGYRARAGLPAAARPAPLAFKSILELGIAELERALTAGQYEHPDRLFFGGTRTQPATGYMQERMAVWAAAAKRIVHVDFHTGLGAHSQYKLFLEDEAGSEQAQWVVTRFGYEQVEPRDVRQTHQTQGMMTAYFKQAFADRPYHGLIAEFGTHSSMRVLGALRAERRAHLYAQPGSDVYEWAKRELMEVFCPASRDWRNTVVEKGVTIIEQAVDSVSARR